MTDKSLDTPKTEENNENDTKNSSEPEKYVIELEADAGEDAIQNALDNFKQFATDRGTEMARIASEMAKTEMAKHEIAEKNSKTTNTSETQSPPKSSSKTSVSPTRSKNSERPKIDEFWSKVHTCYQTIRTLTDYESEQDPAEQPFKSLYEARGLLEKQLIPKLEEKGDCDLAIICAKYQLAVNFKLTNEISDSKRLLEKCLKSLKSEISKKDENTSLNPETSLIEVNILQDLAICNSSLNPANLSESETESESSAVKLLTKAMAIINDQNICFAESSFTIDELLCPPSTEFIKVDVRKKVLSSALLQTVFCLGQAYQQAGDAKNASTYISQTLKLQYEQNVYQPVKWAIDCAALSQYYISTGCFQQGFTCLECAEYMVNNVMDSKNDANKIENADKAEKAKNAENAEKSENLEKSDSSSNKSEDVDPQDSPEAKKDEAKADLARCWVKLIVNFLEFSAVTQIRVGKLSHAKSLSIANDVDENMYSKEVTNKFFNIPKDFKSVPFDTTFFDRPSELNYTEAIKFFNHGLNACNFAESWFSVKNGFVTDSVELAQDKSMLWQYLACFECEPKNQAKMMKRRFRGMQAFLVEDASKLNEKYYGDVLKQLWNTSAEIFADIMTLKILNLTRLEQRGDSQRFETRKIIQKKVNRAGFRAIRSSRQFLGLFNGPDNKQMFTNDSERRAYLQEIKKKMILRGVGENPTFGKKMSRLFTA